ncbi:MAG: hypothetical protein ABFE01_11190, partial [Phycisphaerales bacterium]
MDRRRVMLWGLVGAVACGIIGYVGFYRPQADVDEYRPGRSGVQAIGTVVAAERKEPPQENAAAASTPSE